MAGLSMILFITILSFSVLSIFGTPDVFVVTKSHRTSNERSQQSQTDLQKETGHTTRRLLGKPGDRKWRKHLLPERLRILQHQAPAEFRASLDWPPGVFPSGNPNERTANRRTNAALNRPIHVIVGNTQTTSTTGVHSSKYTFSREATGQRAIRKKPIGASFHSSSIQDSNMVLPDVMSTPNSAADNLTPKTPVDESGSRRDNKQQTAPNNGKSIIEGPDQMTDKAFDGNVLFHVRNRYFVVVPIVEVCAVCTLCTFSYF